MCDGQADGLLCLCDGQTVGLLCLHTVGLLWIHLSNCTAVCILPLSAHVTTAFLLEMLNVMLMT